MAKVSGYAEGGRIAMLSVWTLAGLGIVELATAQLTGSIGLGADGIDSLSDAFVSFMVWLGLKMSQKAPDEKFHFGYYKIESMVAFAASISLMGIGAFILYRSYLAILDPQPVRLPALALAVLLAAGSISLYRALQMRRIAKKYNILSLRLDANNAIKDGSSSFIVFGTVAASSLGFHQMDAIGGMAVGTFILSVSYVIVKQAAMVLLDAYHNPELVEEIRKIVKVMSEVEVKDILLRASGSRVHCEIHIEVEDSMTVGQLDLIKTSVEEVVKRKLSGVEWVVISARARRR